MIIKKIENSIAYIGGIMVFVGLIGLTWTADTAIPIWGKITISGGTLLICGNCGAREDD